MKVIDKWEVPEGGGAPLIVMPNVPKPLHRLAPRNLMGPKEWTAMRKACYAEHEDICEICGRKCGSKLGDPYMHQAHEVYEIDYQNFTSTFMRLCNICSLCHNGIHSGRALTCYRNHEPLWNKEYMLEIAENVFSIVSKWNKQHPDDEPLRVWQTYVQWLNEPSLSTELSKMVDNYDIHFYRAANDEGQGGTWSKWKLIYNGTEYYTPYQDYLDWEVSMDKAYAEQEVNLFSGDEFEELRNNIKEKS